MTATNDVIRVLGIGDVGVRRADLDSIFAGCREALAGGDLVFAQLETTVTDRGARSPNARLAMRSPPAMAAAVRAAGIDVMSFAGNHCLDFGYEGFADTLRHVGAAGIALCGAGANLAAARRPAFLEHGGIRVAFLGYCSILPEGYAATVDRPGCAPMRAHTRFEAIEHDQPGTPARTYSFPHRNDLTALCDDIAVARGQADIVVLSLHWGLHMVPAVIADYQRDVAHAAIDAGAHAVFGHHPHILKGIEFYRGAPILYSLGNFAIEQPHVFDPAITATDSYRHLVSLNPHWRPDRTYMLPEDTRMTGIARLACSKRGVEAVEFVPAWIGDDSAPVVLSPADPRFDRIGDYLRDISASERLPVTIAQGDRCFRLHADSGNQHRVRARP
jgi:poly-gamma-glutamate synthesis protein (capsule biosynthesis protein)